MYRLFLTCLEDFEAKLCEILVPCTCVTKLKYGRNDHNISKHLKTMLQTTFSHFLPKSAKMTKIVENDQSSSYMLVMLVSLTALRHRQKLFVS